MALVQRPHGRTSWCWSIGTQGTKVEDDKKMSAPETIGAAGSCDLEHGEKVISQLHALRVWTVGTALQDPNGFPKRKASLLLTECSSEVSLDCARVKDRV